MSFAILRIKKHSGSNSTRGMSGMTKHNIEREKTPNADPSKKHLNKELIGTGNYLKDVNTIIEASGALVQKNNVKAIEHLMTASPEFFKGKSLDDLKPFTRRCHKFLADTYGKENIASMSLHLDETTPHIHAFVVPVVKGRLKSGKEIKRLSAKRYVDGKKAMQNLQDNFANYFQDLNLERGRKRSKAKHTTVQEYYSYINDLSEVNKTFIVEPPQIQSRPKRIGNIDKWLEMEQRQLQEASERNARALVEETKRRNALKTAEALKLKGDNEKARQINQLKNEIDRLKSERDDKEISAKIYKTKAEENKKQALLAQKYLKEVLSGQISVKKLNDLKNKFKINQGRGI